MAKKNSTKTATKEALSASEPRVINFGQWSGINFKEAPLGWKPLTYKPGESDLPDNFLMLQNNVITTSLKALETRLDTRPICTPPVLTETAIGPIPLEFTGVTYFYENKLFCACKSAEGFTPEGWDPDWMEHWDPDGIHLLTGAGNLINNVLLYYELDPNGETGSWHQVPVNDADRTDGRVLEITCIYSYGDNLIVLTKYQGEDTDEGHGKGEIFTGPLSDLEKTGVSSAKYVPNPTQAPTLIPMGELKQDNSAVPVSRITVVYCYSNKFGPTLVSPSSTISVNYTPVEFHAGRYLQIKGTCPTNMGITGVDIYCSLDENQDMIFIGHADVVASWQAGWIFNWFGSLNDTTQWTSVSLTVPTQNDTKGVDANYVRCHDGRLYFYGGSMPNRLYIGGDPGNELSISRGVGGAFVDLDPGTGLEINATHKFKTYNGASIVTIMCGNKNTSAVKRFNLLETNLTITNELQSKGYEAEEIANVIGCNSHWGSGVWADGLYSLSRYGLGVTTQQMEESNTLRVQYVSDAIQPVFTDRISALLSNARMIHCDEVIYFVLSVPDGENETPEHAGQHTGLDRIIFCYDINQKAWYTYSYENTSEKEILHIFNFDYERWWEGIGIVTPNRIDCIPLTGPKAEAPATFTSIIETGELGLRVPPQIYVWLAQLEFRFDYLCGELDFEVFGLDYYGREYKVYHHVSTKDPKTGEYAMCYEYPVWIRIDKNVETYRVRIKGKAHYRITHFMSKTYQQSSRIDIPYGYDSHVDYVGRHGKRIDDHHYLQNYNNLRDAIVT